MPAVHAHPSDTEVAAANTIASLAPTLRGQALDAFYLAYPDGLTDAELAEVTEVYHYSIAPRRKELVDLNFLTDTGQRRLNRRGNACIVWAMTALAKSGYDLYRRLP